MQSTVFHIGDMALFYRTMGSADTKQRKKKEPTYNLGKATLNADVANAAAVGTSLGAAVDAIAGSPLSSLRAKMGAKPATGVLGALGRHRTAAILTGSTALGAGFGIASKLKKQREERQRKIEQSRNNLF
jgi:hypothetical protein